jgi:hypothetical protein
MSLAVMMMWEERKLQFQHSLRIIETVVGSASACSVFVHICTGNRTSELEPGFSGIQSVRVIKGRIAEARITQYKIEYGLNDRGSIPIVVTFSWPMFPNCRVH